MTIQPDMTRFAAYRASKLEEEWRWESSAATEDIMKLPMLDTVDLNRFRASSNNHSKINAALDEGDDELLSFGDVRPNKMPGSNAASTATIATTTTTTEINRPRKMEHLPHDSKPSAYADSASPAKNSMMASLKHKEDVIKRIEDTFGYSFDLNSMRHPTRENVRAVASYELLPFTDASFAQCTFDANPWIANVDGVSIQDDGDQGALVKAMSSADDASDTFVWYYLPQTTIESDNGDGCDDNDMMENEKKEMFVYSRDYDIQRIDRSPNQQQSFIICIPTASDPKGRAFYTPISGNFYLKRRRAKIDNTRQRHLLKVTRTATDSRL